MAGRHYLWEIRTYLRHVRGLLFLGFVSGIIMNIAVVLPAILLGRAIDTALALERGTTTHGALILAAIAYVGGCTLNLCAQIGKRWWLRTANHRTVANMRSDALRGVLAWPMEWLHDTAVGDTMARVVGDAQVVSVGFNEATTELLDTWLFSLSLFTAMMIYDPQLALLAIAPVPLAFALAYLSGNWIRGRTTRLRQASSSLTAALQEYLSGIRLLRLFGRTPQAVDRVDVLSEELRRTGLSEARLRLGLQPIYAFLVTAGVIMVVWIGGRKVVEGALTTGALVAFLQLYIRFVTRGHRIPLFFNRIQAGEVAYRRMERMLVPPPSRAAEPPHASFMPGRITGIDLPLPPPPECGTGALSVSTIDLSFSYPGSDHLALNQVSLEIPEGSLIGITGPIGSGKTALLQLLTGLYAPASGSIHVGGRASADWPSAERATRVAYLPQAPGLFSGTIRENIGLDGADASVEQMVISRAGLTRDIAELPNGVETLIGEGGLRVSGGQRQRIALARAISVGRGRSPGILFLDDPFSSVDVSTERQVFEALRQAYTVDARSDQRATMVICSHRLAMFPGADRIIVLDEGQVEEAGTHAELIAANGLYARIYHAQHVVDGSPGSGGAA
jgi:ATP-binding cassette, subfamily B, multidrug efflux pump